MVAKAISIEGQVEEEVVSAGSKSERRAVVLTTPSGEKYILRKQGGPAFVDPSLDSLVGHAIEAEGLATGDTLIMRNWEIKR
jgi:hypothetical protein